MSQSLYELLRPGRDGVGRVHGVVTGIVTNNQDPQKLGRVKLKFPWLSDTEESDWARVASPMAGKERGLFLLPEVDDQVLVAFEHGDPAYPYVIGALWNSNSAPPETNADGKNNLRLIKSRSGHVIRLNDKEGEETIEIVDKSGKNSIVVTTKDNSIAVTADADLKITSKNGKVVVDAKGGIELKSGDAIKVEAKGNLELKGAAIKVESQGNLDLKASGQTTVKGATVNIN